MPRISHKIRDKEIKIRVNEDELQKLNESKTQKSLAPWVRDLALGATPIHQADPELVRQIGRIGSNLNQLVKQVNTDKMIDKQVLYHIKMIESLLLQAIESNRNDSKILQER